jgi:Putative peptidoglycan binding domain
MRSALALVAMILSASVDLPAKPSGGGGNSGNSDRASASDSRESGEGSFSGSEGGGSSGGGTTASASHGSVNIGGARQSAGERGASRSAIPGRTGINRFGHEADLSQPRISRRTTVLHQTGATKGNVLTTRDGKPHDGNWSRNNPANRNRFDRQTQEQIRNWPGRKSDFAEACRRHDDHHRHHHDRNWWRHHCPVIILVDWGFWGWLDGWWYPAWGYDSNYCYYEYDGAIYGLDGLLPDEVVANVQSALQALGYYPYEVDGIFGPVTQEALVRFQRDRDIAVTGAIDPATVAALGFTGK